MTALRAENERALSTCKGRGGVREGGGVGGTCRRGRARCSFPSLSYGTLSDSESRFPELGIRAAGCRWGSYTSPQPRGPRKLSGGN